MKIDTKLLTSGIREHIWKRLGHPGNIEQDYAGYTITVGKLSERVEFDEFRQALYDEDYEAILRPFTAAVIRLKRRVEPPGVRWRKLKWRRNSLLKAKR